MSKIITTIILGAILTLSLNAQNENSLGLRFGIGNSNQYWAYKNPEFEWASGYQEKQKGFELFLTSEFPLNKYLSFRPEIGIMEKGFYSDTINSDIIAAGGFFKKNTVEIRNLSLNLTLKGGISVLNDFKIYLLAGLKTDYFMEVSDWIFFINNEDRDDYHDFIFDDYKKIIFSGIVGGGINWKRFFVEIQSNLPLTSSTKNSTIDVQDFYYGFSVGMNFVKFN